MRLARWIVAFFCPPLMIYVLSREIGFGIVGRLILVIVGAIYDLVFGLLLMLPMALLMVFRYGGQRSWVRRLTLFAILVWAARWMMSGPAPVGWFFLVFSLLGVVSFGVATE